MPHDDSGPAFPLAIPPENHAVYPGMSLRDYFAAAGLGAMGPVFAEAAKNQTFGADSFAAWAYKIADAMLAEREKGGGA